VDEEREGSREAEERSPDRRRSEADRGLASGDDCDRVRELLLRHDRAHGSRRRGRVDRSSRASTNGNRRDHPERDVVHRNQHAERADRDRPERVRRDHEPSPVPVIRREPGGQREERRRQKARERDESGLRRRAR
jgi:hypothetical protein